MAMCRTGLQEHDAGEPTAAHEVKAVNAMQRWRVGSTLTGMDPEPAPFFRSDDTG